MTFKGALVTTWKLFLARVIAGWLDLLAFYWWLKLERTTRTEEWLIRNVSTRLAKANVTERIACVFSARKSFVASP